MKEEISIVWFRQDLRTSDNPTLLAASKKGEILPIYILDDCAPEPFKIGGASKVWLHHSLDKLNESLNGNLNLYAGIPSQIFELLIKRYAVKNIFWNICYEPWHLAQEAAIKSLCYEKSINWEAYNSNFLWYPNEIMKDGGSYYKVFTAYKNKSHFFSPRTITPTPKHLDFIKDSTSKMNISELNLLPKKQWHKAIENAWDIGERAAHKKLDFFIKKNLSGYREARDYPMKEQVSRLSPHLHFGEISPSQVLYAISNLDVSSADVDHFISKLIWREFSCYLLYHFRTLHVENFNKIFDNFKWQDNQSFLRAWQTGSTGYPLIDAGMRQLWQTGYMHNRVRMVVASFLVKNLNIHWHQGRDWFWDCLVDADLASNSNNWQWVAGCGVDAAPYFRIFNPITQGEKFDGNGDYTRKFVPELENMPNKYLFKPWLAPKSVLESAGVTLGETYPEPIVDFASSRRKALENYKAAFARELMK